MPPQCQAISYPHEPRDLGRQAVGPAQRTGLRKKAALNGLARAAQAMRIALVGGYTVSRATGGAGLNNL